MIKIRFITAVLATLLINSSSWATLFTTENIVRANDPIPGTGPPLTLIELIESNGRTFVNTYVRDPGRPTKNSLDKVRTVFAVELTNLRNGVNFSPVAGPDDQLTSLVFIGTLDGIGIDANPAADPLDGTILFTSGRVGLFNPGTPFLSSDPTTWAFAPASALAEWTLAPQDDVQPDNGFNITLFPAAIQNTASTDPVNPVQTEGRFKFIEDSPVTEAYVPGGGPEKPGNDFITATPSAALAAQIAAGIAMEGFYATSDLDIETTLVDNLTAAQEAVLNAVGIWGIGASVGGGAGNGFANFGSGVDDDWTVPGGIPAIALNGDFRSDGAIDAFPGVMVVSGVPEASGLCIWCILGMATAFGMKYGKGR